MTTLFLFVEELTEQGCLSLQLEENGQLLQTLQQRDFAEIRQLQVNSTTIIVTSCHHFSLYWLELPFLNEKKIRAAVPFSLEDQLAQNIEDLHFAFDNQHYSDGHYLVVVGAKTYLSHLIEQLDKQQLSFELLTLDWFALKKDEALLTANHLLLVHDQFCGSLSEDLINLYVKGSKAPIPCYVFPDSNPLILAKIKPLTIAAQSKEWIAQRLLTRPSINLAQGDLHHGTPQHALRRWYYLAGALASLWLVILIALTSFKLHSLNKHIIEVDAKIATIYRQFFPKTQQIISPRFRISHLLKSQGHNNDKQFWTLLVELTEAIKTQQVTLEKLHFQNQSVQVTLASKDFAALEAFQSYLKRHKIKVRQTQAATQDKQVVSTLELTWS